MSATSRGYRSRGDSRSGAALIVVLLLLAFLAGLIADFLYNLRINTYITTNQMQQLQGKYAAEAGINAAKGLLLHSSPFSRGSRQVFQNDYFNLLRCRCYETGVSAGSTAEGPAGGAGESGSLSNPQGAVAGDAAGASGSDLTLSLECGEWSLSIDYPMDEYMLHLEIFDEQARLNLNALARRGMNPEEQGAAANDAFKPVVAEMIKIKVRALGLELDEREVGQIVDLVTDWEDWGQSGGGIDSDLNQSYEDGDVVYYNKNGPMDTVSELKMIPGITDEIYTAVKDFFTVYPYSTDTGNFNMKVNIDMASLGVIYALVRGSSYQQDSPTISEDQALRYAQEIVASGFDAKGFVKNRDMPTELRGRVNAGSFMLNSDISQTRWYHVKSTALSPDGVYYTIEAVIMIIPNGKDYRILYWREG